MPATFTDRLNGLTTSVAVKPPCVTVASSNITLSGLQTIGGVALAADDRVLVIGQSNPVNNGIYLADTGTWSRARDFDGARDAVHGTLVVANSDPTVYYKLTTANPVVIGTSPLTFSALTVNGAPNFVQSSAELAAGVSPVRLSSLPNAALGYTVLRVNADPTGATSSDVAIANAILVAKNMGVQFSGGVTGRDQGVDIYLPAGLYTIDNPIVLPRGGNARTFCIGLIGDGEATRIQPSASFPANRAIIEWEAVTARVFNQRIRNLKLDMRTGLTHKAIWFKLNDPATTVFGGQQYGQEEIKELYIEGIQIHGDNTSHQVLVDIEGKAKYSRFEITCDLSIGTLQTYSTILMRCPSVYLTSTGTPGVKSDTFTDNAGLNYCYVNLNAMNARGGRGTAFEGRLHSCFVERLVSGNGALGAASIVKLFGSSCNVVAYMFGEGRQEDPQVYLEACHFNQFLTCNIGTPDSPGPGTAFSLVGCEDNIFAQHPSAAGKPSYSGLGGFLLKLDANCKRNFFHKFHSNAAPYESEVQDLGVDNFIQFFREDTALLTQTHRPVDYVIGPFTQENIAANQTDVDMVGFRWIAPRAGSVTGIVAKLTESRTAGNLTIKVFKSTANLSGGAGVELSGSLRAAFTSTNTDKFVGIVLPSKYTFAAGDEIWCKLLSTSTWAPTTSDVRVWLEVQS